MKRILLFFVLLIFFLFSLYDRYRPVSIELVSPTTKQVEIKGEVMQPGVYTLKWEDTMDDLITMAGGFTENADTTSISLVRIVQDKEVIVIPTWSEKSMEKISINRATTEQLQTIPGIGPAMANRIIEYRESTPFKTLEELMNVKGIGNKTFEKMLPYICL